MSKFVMAVLAAFLTVSCAEKPGGVFVMNEETIENFFEKDKQSWNPPLHLNLLHDQPVAEAEIPPVPQNRTRLYGTLDSNGPYVFSGANTAIKNRGSSFSDSVFGKLGPAGDGGNAWFYADYNPETGQITDARAYVYGFMGGVCDMRNKTDAVFGQVNQSGFILNINGPCLFPQISGSTAAYGLLIQGKALGQPAGQNFQLRYVINDSYSVQSVPEFPQNSPDIFDSGNGIAWIK